MLRFEQLDKSAELPIYEKDRLDLVGPSAVLQLDLNLLNCFHEGDRHLAYLQVKMDSTSKAIYQGGMARK